MTARRIPLGEVPNAANSPARQVISFKRPRDHIEAQEKFAQDLQPKAKRQALDLTQAKLRGSPTKAVYMREDSHSAKQPVIKQHTAFEKRLLAAKDAGTSERIQRTSKPPQESLEGVRRWQHHYKKAFPQFVFYFESVPEDVRLKYSKTVRNLGSREEKFFSKEVTHVITTRSLPTSLDGKINSEILQPQNSSNPLEPRTINPSVLDRLNHFQNSAKQTKSKFNFEAGPRSVNSGNLGDTEQKRPLASHVDVLSRAQNLKMKIWHLEKLQRIMNTIYEVPDEVQQYTAQQVQRKSNNTMARVDGDADLNRMLRQERLHGPSDHDTTSRIHEIVPFKGPYLYVRDIDERTRPILVKEWPKPTSRHDSGEWPQFRAVSYGKCPFVEEVGKEEIDMARQERRAQRQRSKSHSRQQSRAPTPQLIYEDEDDEEDDRLTVQGDDSCGPPLREIRNSASVTSSRLERQVVPPLAPPPPRLPPQIKSPFKEQQSKERNPCSQMSAAEPAASGLQPSNITSAIRSQVMSSTAAAPFVKTGTNKEVHGLKRKVLEKNAGPALSTIHQRQPGIDYCATGRAEVQISRARLNRVKPSEPLAEIFEETTPPEEEDVWLAQDVQLKAKKSVEPAEKPKKDMKPGYCENCKEKYNDFDEHIADRKHRKFALTSDNFKDLDRFLAKLVRPLKAVEIDGF
ncbi:uncharacterized protein KY384_002712 [Bacidia gigantensis]|uniref:uncharacterized protein n=1 Tax=Bacidia gigantensis TaxID=2732470 RepID=UPI001D047299|nr:uncharacterized protein KY384_002712 [Bacidia gigantensis]KAG8532834.1 hypothetical protein KY384_002712 [Bacidia gigantensis]